MSERIRIILDAPLDLVEEALRLAKAAKPQLDRDKRPGWGWHFWGDSGQKYFIRSTKAGISATATPPPEKTNQPQ